MPIQRGVQYIENKQFIMIETAPVPARVGRPGQSECARNHAPLELLFRDSRRLNVAVVPQKEF